MKLRLIAYICIYIYCYALNIAEPWRIKFQILNLCQARSRRLFRITSSGFQGYTKDIDTHSTLEERCPTFCQHCSCWWPGTLRYKIICGHRDNQFGFWVTKRIVYWNNTLQWRHNERDGVSNHQPPGCLLNGLFRRRSKKTSKLRVAGLCVGNSPVTGELTAQIASNAENVSIWWRYHEILT